MGDFEFGRILRDCWRDILTGRILSRISWKEWNPNGKISLSVSLFLSTCLPPSLPGAILLFSSGVRLPWNCSHLICIFTHCLVCIFTHFTVHNADINIQYAGWKYPAHFMLNLFQRWNKYINNYWIWINKNRALRPGGGSSARGIRPINSRQTPIIPSQHSQSTWDGSWRPPISWLMSRWGAPRGPAKSANGDPFAPVSRDANHRVAALSNLPDLICMARWMIKVDGSQSRVL